METYQDIFAFLSQTYWQTQDDYNDAMMAFYDTVINHDVIFAFTPKSALYLEDSWTRPRTVDNTIDQLDDDDSDPDVSFICKWKDDENTTFFTLLYKDVEDGDVRCVTRTLPMSGLDVVPEKLIDSGWKPLRLKTRDNDTRIYIWQSMEQTAYDFIETYKSWATQYSSSDTDEASEDSIPDDSAYETSETDDTPRHIWPMRVSPF